MTVGFDRATCNRSLPPPFGGVKHNRVLLVLYSRGSLRVLGDATMEEGRERATSCYSLSRGVRLLGGSSFTNQGSVVKEVHIESDSNLGHWNSFTIFETKIPLGMAVHQPHAVSGGTIAGSQGRIVNKIKSMQPSECLLLYFGANDSRNFVRDHEPLPLAIYDEIVSVAVEQGAKVCIATALPSPCYVRKNEWNPASYKNKGWCSRAPCWHEKQVARAQREINQKIKQAVRNASNMHYFDIASTFSSEYALADRRHFKKDNIHLKGESARLLSELVARDITLVSQWWKE